MANLKQLSAISRRRKGELFANRLSLTQILLFKKSFRPVVVANQMKNDRIFREKSFHNERFEDPNVRSKRVGKFYSITSESNDRLRTCLLARSSKGVRALECGCGLSETSFELAETGAKVLGIDISEVVLNQTVKRRDPKRTQPQFSLMDVHTLGLASNSINLAYGTGILHHTQMNDMMEDLCRVLSPGGTAIFIEPLGHNPLLNIYRALTPNIRSEDEHPLLMSDLALLSRYFDGVQLDFYYLTSLAAALFQGFPGGNLLLRFSKKLDQHLLKIPLLQRFAWIVFIQLSNPKSQ